MTDLEILDFDRTNPDITDAMIDVTDVHVTYDEPVLRGASFRVEGGQIAALVGSNGAGKTTMLKVIAGLTNPERGTVRVDGVDVRSDRQRSQRRLAYLPQDTRFHDALSPRQVLRFYAGLRHRPDHPIDDLLEEVDLADAADRPCGTLSGGMRQRLDWPSCGLPTHPFCFSTSRASVSIPTGGPT